LISFKSEEHSRNSLNRMTTRNGKRRDCELNIKMRKWKGFMV